MTYRRSLFALALALGGCDLDLGNDKGTAAAPALATVTDDAGVTQFVDQNGCTFVPCEGAYGTNCGFICPTQ